MKGRGYTGEGGEGIQVKEGRVYRGRGGGYTGEGGEGIRVKGGRVYG